MILMYMQVISTSSTLHRSAMNVCSTNRFSFRNPQVPQSKPVEILIIGHNANSLLIQRITKYTETEPKFKELDLLFANSLILIRHLLKENNQLLRKTDGTVPKKNLPDIYKCLCQNEFDNFHQGLAAVMALDKVLFQSKLELTTEQNDCVNNLGRCPVSWQSPQQTSHVHQLALWQLW